MVSESFFPLIGICNYIFYKYRKKENLVFIQILRFDFIVVCGGVIAGIVDELEKDSESTKQGIML